MDRLGSGGMGVLYRAFDEDLHRDVAVKLLISTRLHEPGARERFAREARAVASLKHPNIVTIYEFKEGPPPYLVMEFLEGTDLERRLQNGSPLSLHRALDVVVQLCAALACAHGQGIVHRDVKPANIWLQRDGLVRLLDFGIAKTTNRHDTTAGQALGSVSYMAPEQFQGDPIDGRTDIFSTGVVLYELLARQRPFAGNSPAEVMLKIVGAQYAPIDHVAPELPGPLVLIVARALEVDPERRFQRVDELAEALRQVRGALPPESILRSADGLGVLHEDPDEDLRGLEAQLVAAHPEGTTAGRSPMVPVIAMTALGAVLIVAAVWMSGGASAPLAPSSASGTTGTEAATGPSDVAEVAVTVNSTPEGATIVVDGRDSGLRTPAVVEVKPSGRPEIRLRKAGFKDWIDRVKASDIASGGLHGQLEVASARVTLVARGPYAFEIVEGAQVLSAASTDHELGITAPRTVRLRAVAYLLNQQVALDPVVKRRAVTVPRPGRLTVRAGEACEISVGGIVLGHPPVSNRPIAAGTHTLQIACPQVSRRTVTIAAGQASRVVFQ